MSSVKATDAQTHRLFCFLWFDYFFQYSAKFFACVQKARINLISMLSIFPPSFYSWVLTNLCRRGDLCKKNNETFDWYYMLVILHRCPWVTFWKPCKQNKIGYAGNLCSILIRRNVNGKRLSFCQNKQGNMHLSIAQLSARSPGAQSN